MNKNLIKDIEKELDKNSKRMNECRGRREPYDYERGYKDALIFILRKIR